ncbi:MAG: hypothetical protein H6559_10385 [Lewinellaceae bacterium]|nr:hypothetical protein [Lewinellaceae bacterium]
MGQTIFTTHFLCFYRAFYSAAVWIRLPLQGYEFRKSLRKAFSPQPAAFPRQGKVPASLNPEKEQLYRRYKASFPGILAPSLKDSLLDGEDLNIYNTYEVAVYDGSELVVLSFFDLGKNSAASIMGIYDPDYNRHSLGFFTMLMEIDFCMQRGMEFFYPGYVVPGYSRFDYKLRIGRAEDIEYFDLRTQGWQPYSGTRAFGCPLKKMENRLDDMQQFLIRNNFWSQKLYYPSLIPTCSASGTLLISTSRCSCSARPGSTPTVSSYRLRPPQRGLPTPALLPLR